jgi:hypothetical protein
VAAPFTGGASLAFVPATTAALAAWNAHDAQTAAEHGVAPSHFGDYVQMANSVAGAYYGAGAPGAPAGMTGGAAAGAGGGASGWQRALGVGTAVAPAVIGAAASRSGGQSSNAGGGGYSSSPTSSFAQNMGGGSGKGAAANVMPQGGYDYDQNPMNQLNQRSPNLSQSIFQGRQEAIRDQPFRSGYDVNYLGSDDRTPLVSRTPSIFSSNDSPARTPPPEPELRSKEYTDPGGVKGSSDTGPAKPSKARARVSARA